MTTRACVVLLTGSISLTLASGALVPSAADTFSSPAVDLEQSVVPPQQDDPSQRDLRGERAVDDTSSGASGGAGDSGFESRPDSKDAAAPALDLWAEAMAESAVLGTSPQPLPPVPMNQQVKFFLERFTIHRREVVDVWFGRSGQYRVMIREELLRRGLPEDLVYVAMIESGFNPLAVSRVGAKGMWQFMAGTARSYGLRVDRW